jgi:hypothetical protein
VAALATIRKHRRLKVWERLIVTGKRVAEIWRMSAEKAALKVEIGHPDMPPIPHLTFEYANARAVKTLYCQMMLDRGYLDNGVFSATYAHTDDVLERYAPIVMEVFGELAEVVRREEVETLLRGPVSHNGFARLTG